MKIPLGIRPPRAWPRIPGSPSPTIPMGTAGDSHAVGSAPQTLCLRDQSSQGGRDGAMGVPSPSSSPSGVGTTPGPGAAEGVEPKELQKGAGRDPRSEGGNIGGEDRGMFVLGGPQRGVTPTDGDKQGRALGSAESPRCPPPPTATPVCGVTSTSSKLPQIPHEPHKFLSLGSIWGRFWGWHSPGPCTPSIWGSLAGSVSPKPGHPKEQQQHPSMFSAFINGGTTNDRQNL